MGQSLSPIRDRSERLLRHPRVSLDLLRAARGDRLVLCARMASEPYVLAGL